jgi:acyl-CoA reductase-like NAD-dependent aldehyde dehydrogenase
MPLQEADVHYTPLAEIATTVAKLKDTFASHRTFPLSYRKKQLHAVANLLKENKTAFCDALMKDLRKSKFESEVYEINVTVGEAYDMIDNLDEWAK